ncbi:UvrD-helicase domain-containing protein [Actinopolyspora saharensis]|uniref:UvrD-helicase domain-containing protein n=1 Tax=Actinopolyspora saharensis TaxID=995062 RepID=UPI003F66F630
MKAQLVLHQKAEQELYKLDRTVKAQFYDFSHRFRQNPQHNSLDLKPLKGESRIHRAKINQSYRALLTRTGTGPKGEENWLVVAVRHRKDVYEQLSVAINRISGEIEFVDLSVVGDSALQRAGIKLTPAEPDTGALAEEVSAPTGVQHESPVPLLIEHDSAALRDLGVAEPLIELSRAVTSSTELDQLLENAPLLSKDVLYGLAAGMSEEEVRTEITDRVAADGPVDTDDFDSALVRTTVTTVDESLQAIIEQGDFRAWKVFLHPTQERLVNRNYSGPARVSGGPGTGKTIVALHRVHHLAKQLEPGQDRPILLTTFTKNLTTDLHNRLSSLIEDPDLRKRIDIVHIDQLAARVLNENSSAGRGKKRIDERAATNELNDLLAELGEDRWSSVFLREEWEQVILGQSVTSRSDYFRARRAGRGQPLTRPERNQIWKIVEQLTTRLDKLGVETWAQAAERAARYETAHADQVQERLRQEGASANSEPDQHVDSSAKRLLSHRYSHIVVDEAQDLRPAHWTMLRAMVAPGTNDMFITGDTHQRIYDNQVALGALGINIRGRSSRLTLSYRTTREILSRALSVVSGEHFDDLDDDSDTLAGYRSVLHGPDPTVTGYDSWSEEIGALAGTLRTWLAELAISEHGIEQDPRGRIAVCVADREAVNQVMHYLSDEAGITCAELTKEGPRGDGQIHVGTMHRFKGIEYQRIAIVGVCSGTIPRESALERVREKDAARYQRELRKSRSLLFVAATRARDVLRISWHGQPSSFLMGMMPDECFSAELG